MNRLPPVLLILLGCAGPATPPVASPTTAATARGSFVLLDSSATRIGFVTAVERGGDVILTVEGGRLSPGLHGVHLHAVPACDPPLFQSATGHWNPAGREHGHRNPRGAHLGDLGNLSVDASGTGRGQFLVTGASLGTRTPSLGVPGTALVIHAAADDDSTDPSGNSGVRIACAAILMAP